MGAWISYHPQDKEHYHILDFVAAVALSLLLCFLFVGIAIASDIFMNAIEKICGTTKTVKVVTEEAGVVITNTKEVQVWNDTVANLSLMALGSSAPEILLSAIEITGGLGKQLPGDLGPGTIVGSAAYNLMIISAVCILSLPKNASSRIKLYKVFMVTCVTSLWAYIWMVIVLQWHSPDEVTLGEALGTLAMFPVLVAVAYWADKEFCVTGFKTSRSTTSVDSKNVADREFFFGDSDQDQLYDDDGKVNNQKLQNLYHKLTEIADLTQEEIALILATKLIQGKQHSRMWYRMRFARAIMGGGNLMPVLNQKLQEVVAAVSDLNSQKPVRMSILRATVTSPETYKKKAVVEFQAATLAVSEGIGTIPVTIHRTGKEDVGFKINVECFDGTAKKGEQYENVSQEIMFDPYVLEQVVTVKIIDNVQWNPDSNFFLKLTVQKEFDEKVVPGQTRVIEIIIEDDDKPGKFTFSKRGYLFQENPKKRLGHVVVERADGTDGVVSVSWKVRPGPNCRIVSPDLAGKLEFKHGEKKKFIEIPFQPHDGNLVGADENFDVELESPQGGAKLGRIKSTTCAVSTDQKFKLEINDVLSSALLISEEVEQESSYKDQIKQAVYVNGGDVKNARIQDWILHTITVPLKFIMSLIPPPSFGGGWPCFLIALIAVGILTKIVGDAAGSFGRAIRLDPTITAITVVALGTSLPDTFASRIAAMNDKTADNAIGNVTGSNSVNVFLGLGVPWTIGAFYYQFIDDHYQQTFCVPAGSLTFNVVAFCICATITIVILAIRRYFREFGKAELGGPTLTRWISAMIMVLLWLLYIAVSSVEVVWEKQFSNKSNVERKDIFRIIKGNQQNRQCIQWVEDARTKEGSAL